MYVHTCTYVRTFNIEKPASKNANAENEQTAPPTAHRYGPTGKIKILIKINKNDYY